MRSRKLWSWARIGILIVVIGALLSVRVRRARADDGGTAPALSTDQFTLTLARLDATGKKVPLDASALKTYFNRRLCQCSTNVEVALAMSAAGLAALGDRTVEVTLEVGLDCDRSTAATCKAVGPTLMLTAQPGSTSQSLNTRDLFSAALGSTVTCDALPSTSTRLWAITRVDGSLSGATPSLGFNIGGSVPAAPTAISAQGADGGLLVSWKSPADTSALAGFQVLCSPALAIPRAPAYVGGCPEAEADADRQAPTVASAPATADAGADAAPAPPPALTRVDDGAVCSDLVSAGDHAVRVGGLENGRAYRVAVVAVGIDGTPGALSASAVATPEQTVGFEELYKAEGGLAVGGCAIASRRAKSAGAVCSLAGLMLALVWRRRRLRPGAGRRWISGARRWPLAVLVAIGVGVSGGGARAGLLDDDDSVIDWSRPVTHASPRRWNLELRFGPYRPAIDAEFRKDQAQGPFAQIFGDGRHLLAGLELDRQVAHWGGTWAVGLTAGYYRVSAMALTTDLKKRSGDSTALRLIPLGVSAVYRADPLLERAGFPLVPYLKAGLTCALWSITDSSKADAFAGRTLGWHAAAGVALALDFVDPESVRTMDQETGVNHVSIFAEIAHAALDGFGADNALRVGDTTWLSGLMFEF